MLRAKLLSRSALVRVAFRASGNIWVGKCWPLSSSFDLAFPLPDSNANRSSARWMSIAEQENHARSNVPTSEFNQELAAALGGDMDAAVRWLDRAGQAVDPELIDVRAQDVVTLMEFTKADPSLVRKAANVLTNLYNMNKLEPQDDYALRRALKISMEYLVGDPHVEDFVFMCVEIMARLTVQILKDPSEDLTGDDDTNLICDACVFNSFRRVVDEEYMIIFSWLEELDQMANGMQKESEVLRSAIAALGRVLKVVSSVDIAERLSVKIREKANIVHTITAALQWQMQAHTNATHNDENRAESETERIDREGRAAAVEFGLSALRQALQGGLKVAGITHLRRVVKEIHQFYGNAQPTPRYSLMTSVVEVLIGSSDNACIVDGARIAANIVDQMKGEKNLGAWRGEMDRLESVLVQGYQTFEVQTKNNIKPHLGIGAIVVALRKSHELKALLKDAE